MSGLKTILQMHVAEAVNLGGDMSAAVLKSLRSYRTRLFSTFLVLLLVLMLVVSFAAYGLGRYVSQPAELSAFAGAMGISVGGAVELLRRIWREWSQAELLSVLLQDASEADLSATVAKLITKL
jgi:hypothetical protein